MTPTATPAVPALDALRRPIHSFTPDKESDERFKAAMLGLCGDLEDLWSQDGDETLESDVVWTALYSFPALVLPGPRPEALVGLALGGGLVDGEAADTLDTVTGIRRVLADFEPPGFAAALWRAALDAIYAMIEHFVVLDDQRGTDQCFALLDVAEALADKLTGRS